MTNLEKYLNNWAKQVDDITADTIRLLLMDLALTTRETLGDVECMSVDTLAKYASDIGVAVANLRAIQEAAKEIINN